MVNNFDLPDPQNNFFKLDKIIYLVLKFTKHFIFKICSCNQNRSQNLLRRLFYSGIQAKWNEWNEQKIEDETNEKIKMSNEEEVESTSKFIFIYFLFNVILY